MIIQIDENTIHNLQTVATYTVHWERPHINGDGWHEVVRCNGDRLASGEHAIKFWKHLQSMVTEDLTKQSEQVTD